MTGKLRNSFRSGNLAEHLGILLLKGIAAIAEFARPEDYGFDAIATLLRSDEDGNSYPEDSLIVQLKSYSQESLVFAGDEVRWITSQHHPIFIGRVDLKKQSIELYTTIFINQAVNSLPRQTVVVRYGASSLAPFLEGQDFMPWCGIGEEELHVWLGEPVAKWSITEISSAEWRLQTFGTLTTFVELVRRELDELSLGRISTLRWTTNIQQSIESTTALMKGHPDELLEIAERCRPLIYALMFRCTHGKSEAVNNLMKSLVTCSDALRQLGIVVDDRQRLQKLWESRLAQDRAIDEQI